MYKYQLSCLHIEERPYENPWLAIMFCKQCREMRQPVRRVEEN